MFRMSVVLQVTTTAQALKQGDAALTEQPLCVTPILLGLQQHQLLGQHSLLADRTRPFLCLLTAEQLLIALINLLVSLCFGVQMVDR